MVYFITVQLKQNKSCFSLFSCSNGNYFTLNADCPLDLWFKLLNLLYECISLINSVEFYWNMFILSNSMEFMPRIKSYIQSNCSIFSVTFQVHFAWRPGGTQLDGRPAPRARAPLPPTPTAPWASWSRRRLRTPPRPPLHPLPWSGSSYTGRATNNPADP